MIDAILDHLQGMCDMPCEIRVDSYESLEGCAVFVHFSFDGEPCTAVYYPKDDILFTPTDWQGFYPETPDEIDGCSWITSAGDDTIVMGGLPRVFTAFRDEARKAFGKNVAALREEQGLTQEQLATKAGIKRPNLARIETGRYNVTLDTITRLSAALGEKLV